MIRVAILGSTGSIGRSTLEVIGRHPDRFRVVALAANQAVDSLAEQVERHSPAQAAWGHEEVVAAARAAGYTERVRFRRRERSLVPL